MSKRFDFTITEARSYTLKLEACNSNYSGPITATALPVFSLPTALLNSYGIPFNKGNFLFQYSQPGGVGTPLVSPVAVPAVNLSVSVSGTAITIAIPFGTTFNANSLEYLSGGSPRNYTLVVSHNSAIVLSGLIEIDGYSIVTSAAPAAPAAFGICDAKAS
jgi:hypothetical protein